MGRRLYDLLSKCQEEEEIKFEFAKFFGLNVDTKNYIDLYTPEILFEFKYDINMRNVVARSKAIAQTLYYIRRLKYGKDIRVPSFSICVVDKNEAIIVETENLKNFYLNSKAGNYDWDLAPSNPCGKLVKALSESDILKNLYVYDLKNAECEEDFIDMMEKCLNGEQLSLFGNKKEINENNFYRIFEYWNSLFGPYVENGRKSSEYFMVDIENGRTSILSNNEVLFRMNSGENITKNMPLVKYNHFWETYDKIINPKEVIAIRQKMDRMSETSMRRFTGEFFTPLCFVEKAIDYIGRVCGKKWWLSGKYRIWDMASGTGNLEYELPAEALQYCYISSLLEDDVEYCKTIYPEATVFQYDYLNDDVNLLDNPNLMNFGLKYKMPKKLYDDLQDDSIKWIIFINPPYVMSNNNERRKENINKNSVSMTEIQKLMAKDNLGETSREIMSQFLYRIGREFTNKSAFLSIFSKIKYINAPNDQKMRASFFKYKYEKGFIFSSENFDGCKAKFPVGFFIWNMGVEKELERQEIIADIYNNSVEKIGTKKIHVHNQDLFLSKWVKREKTTKVMPPFSSALSIGDRNKDRRDKVAEGFLASLMCKGNELANQNNTAILSGPYVSAGAFSITANNFEKAMVIHTVRRLPRATWLNDRDQLIQPKYELDKLFISDCVMWSIFSNSNNTVSIAEVLYEKNKYRIDNQLFPFVSDKLKQWEIGLANIKNQIWGKKSERFAALWLLQNELSPEAKELLIAAEKYYKLFYENLNELPWPKYKITCWDVGWWQINSAMSETGLGTDLYMDLKRCHKKLGEKLLPQIYEYGFLDNVEMIGDN